MEISPKARMTVTIDSHVLKAIDEERGDSIPRSRYVDYLLKKALLEIRKERTQVTN
jgi:metal-responsive CopG/Arc/MetJ family transcriptional regulator